MCLSKWQYWLSLVLCADGEGCWTGAFEKFAKSAWGQKIAKRKAKAALNDFERYQAMKKKQARSKEISKTVESMS